VLVHTAGFPNAPLDVETLGDRAARVRQMEEWTLETEPGSTFAYHGTSAPWVWAELIERATGKDYRVAIRERVLDPLGLDRLEVGVPAEHQHDVQPIVQTGEPPTLDAVEEFLGRKLPEQIAALLSSGAAAPPGSNWLLALARPPLVEIGIPGGGGVSDAASLALFYQALLHNPDRLWEPGILRDATSQVRNNLPDLLGRPASRTLGLVIATAEGAEGGPRTFGHPGAYGQLAWADPATGLSFAFLTNGADRNAVRQYRRDATLSALAARCAG
jgi:CubicO group peptidase (beta-lactamase class C family)